MELLQALKGFPSFLIGLTLGLLLAALTQVEIFLLIVFAILVGIATNAVTGAALAIGIYIVFFILGEYVALANRNFTLLLRVISDERNTTD